MHYKLSYYTVLSEVLNSQKEVILFCTRTAKAVKISDILKNTLISGQLDQLDQEIKDKLIEIKAIVPFEEDELGNIINENNLRIADSKQLYEVIQPTAMCQLGCDYCGQQHTKDYISNSLSQKLLERIQSKIENSTYNSLFIGWFGGEPLMGLQQIRWLTKELKKLTEAKGMKYGAKIVTNGLSLKQGIFQELTKELSIEHIEVTLDGTAAYHDQRRHTKEYAATFDIIFKNLLDIFALPDFNEYNCGISIRCNVDGRNIDGVSPLLKLLADHELQNKLAYFYPVGVYSWGGNDAHQKSLTKEEFAEKEIEWLMEMLEFGFIPKLLPGRVKQVCMAVSPVSEMYDAFGNIFKCTEVSYSSNYKNTPYDLGNLNSNNHKVEKNNVLQQWNTDVSNHKFPCSTCKMLPVCGGGCPKSWHEDMRACPTAKFNIKERLALAYVAANADIRELVSE